MIDFKNSRPTLHSLADLLNSGDITSVALCEAYLKRAEEVESKIDGFLHLDKDTILNAAKASDERRAAGKTLSPYDGVPVACKDNIAVKVSESKVSDFALNEERTQAVFSCESGVLSVVETQTGKVLKELEGQNVDNVYRVDFKHGMVSAAGQDRRGALYDVATGKGSYIQGDFLIYATALSPLADKVAFAMDEKNNISIYNTSSKSKTALLKGQKSTLNVIIFKDETHLYSASDDSTVMVWELKK